MVCVLCMLGMEAVVVSCACPIVLLQWRHELETFFMKLDVDSDGVVDWVRHVPHPIVLVSATSSD